MNQKIVCALVISTFVVLSSHAIDGQAVSMSEIPQHIKNAVASSTDGSVLTLTAGELVLNKGNFISATEAGEGGLFRGRYFLKDGVMYQASAEADLKAPYLRVEGVDKSPKLFDIAGANKLVPTENASIFKWGTNANISAISADPKKPMSATDAISHLGSNGSYRVATEDASSKLSLKIFSEGNGFAPQALVEEKPLSNGRSPANAHSAKGRVYEFNVDQLYQ